MLHRHLKPYVNPVNPDSDDYVERYDETEYTDYYS